MERKFQIVCYLRVEPESPNYLSYNDAVSEKEHLELLFPENIYKIEGVETDEETESMDEIRLTAFVKNNRIFLRYQNEVENLALDSLGTHENIYFDETPVTDRFSVKFNREENVWELKPKGI